MPTKRYSKILRVCMAVFVAVAGCAQAGPGSSQKPAAAAPITTDISSIEFERQPCYGRCPVYDATLRPDGTLTYVGTKYVDHLGSWTAQSTADDFGKLAQILKDENFDGLGDDYHAHMTDQATQIITVTEAGNVKEVSEYGNAGPAGLHKVQDAIDDVIARAKDWKQSGTPAP